MSDLSHLSALSEENSSEDSIPDSWKALGNASTVAEESVIDGKIRVHMFYTEHSSNLDTGKGRDDLTEMVYKQLSTEYDPGEFIDLQVFLLDELDERDSLRGKDVFNYLEEFVEKEGKTNYLSETSY